MAYGGRKPTAPPRVGALSLDFGRRAWARVRRLRRMLLLCLVLAVVASSRVAGARAQSEQDRASVPCEPSGACPFDAADPGPPPANARSAPRPRVALQFFWGVGCPHCEEARVFLGQLQRDRQHLSVEAIEVRNDPVGRRRFIDTMRRLGTTASGVPTFVVGDRYLVGFARGLSEAQIVELVDGASPRSHAPAAATDEMHTKWLRAPVGERAGSPAVHAGPGAARRLQPVRHVGGLAERAGALARARQRPGHARAGFAAAEARVAALMLSARETPAGAGA